MRLAPPDVKETNCILRRSSAEHTPFCRVAAVEAVCSISPSRKMQRFFVIVAGKSP